MARYRESSDSSPVKQQPAEEIPGTPRNVQAIVEKIRAKCLARGASGIKGLGTFFRIMDDDGSRALNMDEFATGLRDYGLVLSADEVQQIARWCDTNGDGTIDFDEFLRHVRPPMNETRMRLVDAAFNKLDANGSGTITVEDVARMYDPRHHPKYVSGEWDAEKVFLQFLKSFDSPADPDGTVTREEFHNYYAGVSASIDLDVYFDLMIRQSWGL
eukprot:Amastigsp_a339628_1865.p1 type:complete len:215 gc:universal Amastigsp_a339628_1865:662-18(-)